ncbi:Uncharacterised protein [uncultured archaeon]|nr:Uncharacterised protein [uncultured archaeon]
MKIVSWNGNNISPQTGQFFLQQVRAANGPIVLPLMDRDVAQLKILASKPEANVIAKSFYGDPMIYKLGLIAILEGKDVRPLFTGPMMKRGQGKFALPIPRSLAERLVQAQDPTKGVAVGHQEWVKLEDAAMANVEAHRMTAVFERYRKQKPALIIAEDNQALQLGRMFRVRVTRATKHSHNAEKIANRVMRRFTEIMRRKLG